MWQIIVGILGCVVYLYLMWRVLRENYKEEDVVAFGWVSLLAYLIGSRLAYGLINWGMWAGNPMAWLEFWKMGESNIVGGYVLWMLVAWLVVSDRGWRFFTFAEDNLGFLLWLNGIFLLVAGKWMIVAMLVVVALVSWWLRGKYRSWVWYKSGRKGFVFLAANIIFFIGLSLIYRNIYYSIPALICGVGLGILGSERNSK